MNSLFSIIAVAGIFLSGFLDSQAASRMCWKCAYHYTGRLVEDDSCMRRPDTSNAEMVSCPEDWACAQTQEYKAASLIVTSFVRECRPYRRDLDDYCNEAGGKVKYCSVVCYGNLCNTLKAMTLQSYKWRIKRLGNSSPSSSLMSSPVLLFTQICILVLLDHGLAL